MSTNEHSADPGREQIIKEATYFAAAKGCYDTSAQAQKAGILTSTVVDTATLGEAVPAGATHQFYVMINDTGYMVTSYADGYKVDLHDRLTRQRKERELRDAVLDAAIWYLTGQDVAASLDDDARTQVLKQLLDDGEEVPRDPADPVAHPVIRDEEPDPSGVGNEDGLEILRQWTVEIGPSHRCRVAVVGYDADDGSPALVLQDVEDEGSR